MSGKTELLKKLSQTYCRIQPAKNGVGVFAIRAIPSQTDPFFGCRVVRWLKFNLVELRELPAAVREMIQAFYGSEGELCYIPEHGLNGNDISFYLNHSAEPNVRSADGGATFYTTRPIQPGEELLADYATYDPEDPVLKL